MAPDVIPWCVPDLAGDEACYLQDAITAGEPGPAGKFLPQFETGVAALAGATHAVATCSGTAALHIALLLAGVRPGDEVIIPAWTFIATANAVRHCGADPVVLDVDPRHWQLDPSCVKRFLSWCCTHRGGHLTDTRTGRRVAAIVPVDLLGHPADLDTITGLAEQAGITIVEDAAQSLGARYRRRPAGSSGLAATSFNTNKLLTAGAGGAILTSDPDAAARARHLINQARCDPAGYRHDETGWNYRMSNLHAAIGCAQLDRADELIAARRRIHDRYRSELTTVDGIAFQAQAPWAAPTWWLTTITADPRKAGITGPGLRGRLAETGIQTGPPWTPVHQAGAYPGSAPWDCPVAERLGRHALHLPSSASLTTAQQDRVITAIRASTRNT